MKFIQVYDFDSEYHKFESTSTYIKPEDIIRIEYTNDENYCIVFTKNKKININLLISFIVSLVISTIFAIVCISNVRIYNGLYLFCGLSSILMFMFIPYGNSYSKYYVKKDQVE